nr:hypothetical protein [Streptomyces sp. TLI_235]
MEIVEAELLPPPSPVDETPEEAMDAQAVEDLPPTNQAPAGGTVMPAPTSSPAVPNPNGSTGFWWLVAGTAAYLTYKAVKGCTTCQSTRTITCFKCQGTGQIATTATCPACNGNRTRDGYTLCPACRGASTVSVDVGCQNCDSSGRRRCPSCY